MKRRTLDVIRVFSSPVDRRRGRIRIGGVDMPCALGRAGIVRRKREGDGGTPAGRLRVLAILYRPDRIRRPRTSLPVRPIRPQDGWCDDPGSRLYNRPIALPHRARHERLWREDDLYDVVVDLAWNRRPAAPGRGSAIFLHAARSDVRPTEGCVAVHRNVVGRLVERIGPRTRLHIG